jgi:hypothetical protein
MAGEPAGEHGVFGDAIDGIDIPAAVEVVSEADDAETQADAEQVDISAALEVIQEAEDADLPLGFGRD